MTDPTRMSQLDELKARISRIAKEALLYAAEMEFIDGAMETAHDNTQDSLAQILEVCMEK